MLLINVQSTHLQSVGSKIVMTYYRLIYRCYWVQLSTILMGTYT